MTPADISTINESVLDAMYSSYLIVHSLLGPQLHLAYTLIPVTRIGHSFNDDVCYRPLDLNGARAVATKYGLTNPQKTNRFP